VLLQLGATSGYARSGIHCSQLALTGAKVTADEVLITTAANNRLT